MLIEKRVDGQRKIVGFRTLDGGVYNMGVLYLKSDLHPFKNDGFYYDAYYVQIDTDGKIESFKFWNVGTTREERRNIIDYFALHDIMERGMAGLRSFESFYNEYGYSRHDILAEYAYANAIKTARKLKGLGISEKDMEDIVDDLESTDLFSVEIVP